MKSPKTNLLTRIVESDFIGKCAKTNRTLFIRRKLAPNPQPDGLSKENKIGFAHWPGGLGVAIITSMMQGLYIKAFPLNPSVILHGHKMIYGAQIYRGKPTPENVEEVYYFTCLPPELESLESQRKKLDGLQLAVLEMIKKEDFLLQKKARELELERLKHSPPRLPYEPSDIDHHKNQYEVSLKLLQKAWPNLAKALNECQKATSDTEVCKARQRVRASYIADHLALCGTRPTIKQGEEAELWKDDFLVRLINQSLDSPMGRVDKINWQLANGWIIKNYYRMNPIQLEEAFAVDWGYVKKIRGETLAKRAQRIGLLTALKRGRPELHRFQDLPS